MRLGQPDGIMVIGEGIETVLSAMQLWGLPGLSALSASGLAKLCVDELPSRMVLAADRDPAGLRAAADLRQRLAARGKHTRVLIPDAGMNDFNDLLRFMPSGRSGQ